jgi:hypothetical protein
MTRPGPGACDLRTVTTGMTHITFIYLYGAGQLSH